MEVFRIIIALFLILIPIILVGYIFFKIVQLLNLFIKILKKKYDL